MIRLNQQWFSKIPKMHNFFTEKFQILNKINLCCESTCKCESNCESDCECICDCEHICICKECESNFGDLYDIAKLY